MSKITIPKSLVEKIKKGVIAEIILSKKGKFDAKKDLRLSPIDHGIISDSILEKIKIPKDGTNGNDGRDGKNGKDLIFTEEIRNDLVREIIPRIPEPLDGVRGESGRKGERGTSYVLTDQDKLDVSEITKKVTQKSVNALLNKIITDIKSGKIRAPRSGIGPKDAVDLINKGIGNTDWQSGGTDPITTRGDVIRGDISGDSERLALGTNGQVLGSDGADLVFISIPGGGDMLKSVYDTGDNGIVDNSEKLEANDSAYHLDRTNHSGTQAAVTISDFDTEVANETNVAANTTHRSSDGKNHADVVLSNTHRGSNGVNHANVVLNDTHRGVVSGNPHSVTKTEVSLGNVDDVQQVPLSQKAAANGVATLDAGTKIPAAQLPASVMEYKGAYNIATNTPTLIDGTGTNGDLYRCSVGGSRDFGSGSITLVAGDALVYNGTIWEKIPSEDLIQSVNSQTGVVVLDSNDIAENTNLYYTEGRVDANSNVAANSAKVTNANHTGEVTGDTALTIANDAVTYAKMQNVVADQRLLGNIAGAAGIIAELTAAQVRTLLSLVIGTDVLAEQTVGIADNNLLEVDGSPNSAEYARFTAAGLEGRTESEMKADFNMEIGTDVQKVITVSASTPGSPVTNDLWIDTS